MRHHVRYLPGRGTDALGGGLAGLFFLGPFLFGTGQGLAICRSIVETKHGGRLSVQSTVGAGTAFTISLPMGDPVGAKAETESAA